MNNEHGSLTRHRLPFVHGSGGYHVAVALISRNAILFYQLVLSDPIEHKWVIKNIILIYTLNTLYYNMAVWITTFNIIRVSFNSR